METPIRRCSTLCSRSYPAKLPLNKILHFLFPTLQCFAHVLANFFSFTVIKHNGQNKSYKKAFNLGLKIQSVRIYDLGVGEDDSRQLTLKWICNWNATTMQRQKKIMGIVGCFKTSNSSSTETFPFMGLHLLIFNKQVFQLGKRLFKYMNLLRSFSFILPWFLVWFWQKKILMYINKM